jgi:hypothetical protein
MKRLVCLMTLALAVVATSAFAQADRRVSGSSFASDYQTVPAMANTRGFGGATFQTYVTLLNPTASGFTVEATLYDAAGVAHEATIPLAAGELKTWENFLDEVFDFSGAGAVRFRSPETIGGTNRFIINAEVWSGAGMRYGTSIPAVEFAGSNSPSFAGGITVSANTRTNVGCFNESDAPNAIKATVLDDSGNVLGSVDLNLAANAWGQTGVNVAVTNGTVKFTPTEAAVCYASVVSNATHDGRFIEAAEYRP